MASILSRGLSYIVDQSLVNQANYERSYNNLSFIRTWPEKTFFLEMLLVQIQ